MYKCATCKGTFDGVPALSNNAGTFCRACETERRRKMIEGTRRHYAALGSSCLWCGVQVPSTKSGETSRVCPTCEKGRDWLLGCIRHSDRVALHVAKTEERELPLRRERQAKEAAAALAAQAELKTASEQTKEQQQDQKTPVIDRLERLERLLEKLTNELGGVP